MFEKLLILILFLAAVAGSACSKNPASVKPVRVEGTAMMPAFNDGDKILMEENFGELKRGEVVIHLYPKDRSKFYIKRIIGLPGETIQITGGKVYINGQLLDEPYLDASFNNQKQTIAPQFITENNYYVMGDNRDNSSDSRYWGTVARSLIQGKYYMTYSKAGE
jgi:signal peptidase I